MQTIIERARTYVSRITAESGQRGHAATYNAAVALVKGFALPVDEALAVLLSWNQTNANPPWTEADLRHKIRDAAKSGRPLGHLLKERPLNPPASCIPHPAQPAFDQAAEARAKRAQWPAFHRLRPEYLQAVAELRQVPLAAVWLAHEMGFLRGAAVDGHPSFIIHEGTFAQARRFDGQPFIRHDGTTIKAKNLPGSKGRFIGKSWLGKAGVTGPPGPVLIVEGVIGLLEATAAAWLTEADCRGWTVLAATSASARLDDTWLARLSGRRVRLVPDADTAGLEAAGKWTAELRRVGCLVDAFRLPHGVKDIGPLVADPKNHRADLNTIFHL